MIRGIKLFSMQSSLQLFVMLFIKCNQRIFHLNLTIFLYQVVYRLFGKEGHPLADIIQEDGEPAPEGRVLCRHPNVELKRVYINPTSFKCLQKTWVKNGKVSEQLPSIHETKKLCENEIKMMRKDHVRLLNPTPYKVSVSEAMYQMMHRMILEHTPIREME